jgi:hypothetical protein
LQKIFEIISKYHEINQGSIYWKIPSPLGGKNMKRRREKGGKCKRKRKKRKRKRKKGERK